MLVYMHVFHEFHNMHVCIYIIYNSASVSVLTIEGTECDLRHLGQVANLSGGNVMCDCTYIYRKYYNRSVCMYTCIYYRLMLLILSQ